jgi:hypothetical protein
MAMLKYKKAVDGKPPLAKWKEVFHGKVGSRSALLSSLPLAYFENN